MYLLLQFRVFAVCLIGVLVSLVSVNCSLDDTIAELTSQIAHLAKTCSPKAVSEMRLRTFQADPDARCNDGSPAG